jgi:hypothetical protein
MGYGFCIKDNPCDQVVLRLAKPPPPIHAALRHQLPATFTSADWSTDESGFYLRGSAHYAGGYVNPLLSNSGGSSTGASALRGIPPALLSALHIMVSFAFESGQTSDRARQAERWWATFDALLARLEHKRDAIVVWDEHLPAEGPRNRCQAFAKIYRDGQLAILNEVIAELDGVLGPLDRGEVDMVEAFEPLLDLE